MSSEERVVRTILEKSGGLMIGGHYVLSDQKHTDRYVEKTRFLRRVDYLQILADMIAKAYSKKNIEVVIAPAVGGVGLAAIVAVGMMQAGFGAAGEIQWGYAEPFRGKDGELILYELKRGFAQMVEGKRVLVVEDVITTGRSAALVVKAVRANGGNVVGLSAIINRGRVTSLDVGHPGYFKPLLTIDLPVFDPEDCELCKFNVPVNEELGHGREFMLGRK